MPFVSKAQKGFLYANHPDIAKKFQEHTPKGAKLPEHAAKTAQLKAALKTAVVAGPGPSVVPGVPGPLQIQPQASQPAQGPAQPAPAAGAIPQVPGANDHPSAQPQGQPAAPGAPQGPAGAPTAPGAPPGPQGAQPPPQPLNAADATAMAQMAKMKPTATAPMQTMSKAAAVYVDLMRIAVRSLGKKSI